MASSGVLRFHGSRCSLYSKPKNILPSQRKTVSGARSKTASFPAAHAFCICASIFPRCSELHTPKHGISTGSILDNESERYRVCVLPRLFESVLSVCEIGDSPCPLRMPV